MSDVLEIAAFMANKAEEISGKRGVMLNVTGAEAFFKFDYKGRAYSVRVKQIEGLDKILRDGQ